MIDLLIALGCLGRYAAAWKALLENNIAEHAAGLADETAENVRLQDDLDAARKEIPARFGWAIPHINSRIMRRVNYYRRMEA